MNRSPFEQELAYTFKDTNLLRQALTHRSCCQEEKDGRAFDNQRLEFLGDALLDAVIGAELFRLLPEADEGRLSRTRADIVREETLAAVGKEIGLTDRLLLPPSEEKQGLRHNNSLIGDAVEALIGAIYLDGGFAEAQAFILRAFRHIIPAGIRGDLFMDYKSALQEICFAGPIKHTIRYVEDREEGPDHAKVFYVHAEVDGRILGRGQGKTKKEAEQEAARLSLIEVRQHVL